MRFAPLLLLTLFFGLVAQPAAAQDTGSPYSVTVPVSDVTEAQRDDAFSTALGQVLTRVAGGQDLRSKSGYDDALKGAVGMVQKYQYIRDGDAIVLKVNFDPGAVNHLITQLGVPKASARPPVLLLIQGADGKLLGADSLSALAQGASAQGYQVIYPDTSSPLDLTRVATADPTAMAGLTAQYHTGLVLLGRFAAEDSQWTLISGGRAQSFTSAGATEDAMMTSAAGTMAAMLGQQLNVVGSGTSKGRLQVAGLKTAQDYANLLNVLQNDPMISQVVTTGAQDGVIDFDIQANLPLSALVAHLTASGRLLQGQAEPDADISLRWLH